MAKNMALVSDGVVVNILWCSDKAEQTDTLINPDGRPVGIGDTYSDGKFYRDGKEVLTPLESAMAENEQLKTENSALMGEMANLIEEVYQSDTANLGA